MDSEETKFEVDQDNSERLGDSSQRSFSEFDLSIAERGSDKGQEKTVTDNLLACTAVSDDE